MRARSAPISTILLLFVQTFHLVHDEANFKIYNTLDEIQLSTPISFHLLGGFLVGNDEASGSPRKLVYDASIYEMMDY